MKTALLLTSCVYEKDLVDSSTHQVQLYGFTLFSSDSVWVANDSTFQQIMVRVDANAHADSVILTLMNLPNPIQIYFKDDGGIEQIENAGLPWLLNSSGDVIPNDNIWSLRIAVGLIPLQTVDLKIEVHLENQSSILQKRWLIVQNLSPVILSMTYPDSIYSGTDTAIIISTFDPDTLIESGIRSVVTYIYQLPNRIQRGIREFQTFGSNQTWRLILPYSFASGKQTGDYRFIVTSTDLLRSSVSDSFVVWIENRPPICDTISLIGNTVVGQTLVLFDSNATDTVVFQFDVSWYDPQSASDIRSMNVELFRDLLGDSSFWDTLLVEGTGFDSVALDGKFIVPFQLDNRNRPTHPNYRRPPFDHYRIKFYAMDGGNNISNDTTFHFYIVQPPLLTNRQNTLNNTTEYHQKFFNRLNPY
ncbi:MAG: hypothetical protein N2450_04195 [bacterium]|nr:hypothetical protein [bacterium]